MKHLTKKEIEALSENEEVQNRIFDLLAMDGREFLREVCYHPTPEELEEYLEENPDERVYMKERPVK